ncbi:phage portal protein, partial [Corynebacterium flavescens]|uniref:phage portal protein n=1 Tax=Corynebacterium flavescens TaxID=28028 RepID=UPI003FD509C9
MSTDSLLRRLDYAQPVIARRDEYYRGEQPLKFLIDRVDPSVMRFNVNIARVAVQAVAERIRLSGVEARVGGRDVSDGAWKLVQDSDLPMTLQSAITDMLAVGSAYLIVWADGRGTPVITAESAEQVIVERHPVTRSVVGAVKRWEELDPNGTVLAEHVITYG